MDQQLSLTVGHGLSLKQIQKTLPTLVSTVHVRFHSQHLCVRLDSQAVSYTHLVGAELRKAMPFVGQNDDDAFKIYN